jgi:hypothetical protein
MAKQSLPMPVIIGVVAVLLVALALFFMKGALAEPHTPRPDPKMFGGGSSTTPNPTSSATP